MKTSKANHKRSIAFLLPLVLAAACSRHGSPPGDGTIDGQDDAADATEGCPAGLAMCGGRCVDLSSDHSHCGVCNNECQPFEVCENSTCILECPAGQVECSGECVDVNNDVNNCGGCGKVCEAGDHAYPVCESGVCSSLCIAGWSDTDGDGDCETCTPASDEEICNGIDDNCNEDIDEGFDCAVGSAVSCTTRCGSTGTGTCTSECTIPGPDACTPPAEECNGMDDDCDGTPDDGFNCTPGDTETGDACGMDGHLERTCLDDCNWGSWNCVGEADCSAGEERGCGNCGTQVCSTAGVWGPCEDEGVCAPGETGSRSCRTCGTQTRTCRSDCTWAAWTECVLDSGSECFDDEAPQTETCGAGNCGERTRECRGCTWGTWSDCEVRTGLECFDGDINYRDCGEGACGNQTKTCSGCVWEAFGPCELKPGRECFEDQRRCCTTVNPNDSMERCVECMWNCMLCPLGTRCDESLGLCTPP